MVDSTDRGLQPPCLLEDLIFRIEFRGPRHQLTDDPAASARVYASALLKDCFQDLPTRNIKPPHLSWEKFQNIITRDTLLSFDMATSVMGYRQIPDRPGQSQQWGLVQDELSFHNAVAVMRNNTVSGTAVEEQVFYLFSPKPSQSPFGRQREARPSRMVSAQFHRHDLSLTWPRNLLIHRRHQSRTTLWHFHEKLSSMIIPYCQSQTLSGRQFQPSTMVVLCSTLPHQHRLHQSATTRGSIHPTLLGAVSKLVPRFMKQKVAASISISMMHSSSSQAHKSNKNTRRARRTSVCARRDRLRFRRSW